MIVQLKMLTNYEEVEDNASRREKEVELGIDEATPKLPKKFKYVPMGIHLKEILCWYMSVDLKDVVLVTREEQYQVKAEKGLLDALEAQFK